MTSTTTLKLKSKQGEIFEVDVDIAFRSVMIKNMVEDTEGGELAVEYTIPLPTVDSKALAKVIEFCSYHHGAEQANQPDTEKEVWDKEFIQMEDELLFGVIMAANYLDIKPLLDLACKKVAAEINGKTADEIRARFNITNDFTPEEEEEVKREWEWCGMGPY